MNESMSKQIEVINVNWDGPYSLEQVKELKGQTDYGVYQIYGAGPTYRHASLLYIGLAGLSANSTFSVRVLQDHPCYWGCGDDKNIFVYVGRLMGPQTPENAVWTRQIQMAEALLIYAHYPPYNKQKDGAPSMPEFPSLRVFNWGNYRDLFQEISGERLGKMPPMVTYGAANRVGPPC